MNTYWKTQKQVTLLRHPALFRGYVCSWLRFDPVYTELEEFFATEIVHVCFSNFDSVMQITGNF